MPASINVLSAEDIRQSPAVVADDVLRQVPTFSLFRRTSSLSSHPTTQGVSLRGIGPSGVSRTLVLLDGVPFNDPFGGWVYWTRVPLESTDRIEMVDGSSSSLYGNYAMGGVINIVTSRAGAADARDQAAVRHPDSPKFDFFASDVWGKLGVAVEGSPSHRRLPDRRPRRSAGSSTTKRTVDFTNVNAKVDYNPTDRVNIFFRTGYFRRGPGQRQAALRRHRRGEQHALEVRQRRRADRAAGSERPAGARCSPTSRPSSATSSRCRRRR